MVKKKSKKARAKQISPAQAERLAKRAARKRTIKIELTEEQLEALTKQWKRLKPAEAAEIVFTCRRSPTSRIKVAGYSYHGDTCCA